MKEVASLPKTEFADTCSTLHRGREVSSLAELGVKKRVIKKPVQLVVASFDKIGYGNIISFTMPIMLECATNKREHWRKVAERKKHQRDSAMMYTVWAKSSGGGVIDVKARAPLEITVTRIGKRRMDEHDNLATSAKYVVDGIAKAIGIDDGDVSKIKWVYKQEIGKAYGCKVSIQMS